MSMEKVLGKIASVRFGAGGYQCAQFGLSVVLAMGKGGSLQTADFRGTWTARSSHAEYSHEEWMEQHAATMVYLIELMKLAKVDEVSKLAGKPVEVTMNGLRMESWRILTEVL